MGVEQTSQLIQLILNSVLMVIASVVILGSLLVRYTAIVGRCRTLNRDYLDAVAESESGEASPEIIRQRLLPLRAQLYRVRLLCRAAQNSILAMYLGLFFFVMSTLCLALRTVFNLNGLINLSLWIFVVGMVINLCGIALALLDFYIARSSLHEEVAWLFNTSAARFVQTVSPTRLSGRRGQPLTAGIRSGSAQVS
jgi:hypothetical protein